MIQKRWIESDSDLSNFYWIKGKISKKILFKSWQKMVWLKISKNKSWDLHADLENNS